MRTKKFDIENAIKNLEFWIEKYKLDIKNLPIFYTVCHSASKSGMSMDIEVFFILENEKRFIGRGIVKGCGMDIGYSISSDIFEWYKTKNKIKYEDLPYQKYFSHRWF